MLEARGLECSRNVLEGGRVWCGQTVLGIWVRAQELTIEGTRVGLLDGLVVGVSVGTWKGVRGCGRQRQKVRDG